MKYTEAETDLHNAITSAVEEHTGQSRLATAVADQVVTEGALNPTPALLRFLADKFDTAELGHIGFRTHAARPLGADYALRMIADALEKNA